MRFVSIIAITLTLAVIPALAQVVLEERKDELGREIFLKVDKQNGAGEIETTETTYHGDSLQVHRKVRKTRDLSDALLKEISEIYDPEGNLLERREVRWNPRNGKIIFGERKGWIYPPQGSQVVIDEYYDTDLPDSVPYEQRWKSRIKPPLDDAYWLLGTWVGHWKKDSSDPYILEFVREGDKIVGYLRKNNYWSEYNKFKEGQVVWTDVEVREPEFGNLHEFEATGKCIASQIAGIAWNARIQIAHGSDYLQISATCAGAAKIDYLQRGSR